MSTRAVRPAVCIRQCVVAATVAQMQGIDIAIHITLDVYVGIAVVDFQNLLALRHLRGVLIIVRPYLHQVVQMFELAVIVWAEVSALPVQSLHFWAKLTGGVRSNLDATIPGADRWGDTAAVRSLYLAGEVPATDAFALRRIGRLDWHRLLSPKNIKSHIILTFLSLISTAQDGLPLFADVCSCHKAAYSCVSAYGSRNTALEDCSRRTRDTPCRHH